MYSPETWNGIFPSEITEMIKELGRKWNQIRPKFDPDVEREWDEIIDAWVNDVDTPLIIRKSSSFRGSEIVHNSGRRIILSDNSPAQWVCYLSLCGKVMSLPEIRQALIEDRIPFALALTREEKARSTYKETLKDYSINKLGWKLCHKEPVGIGNIRDPKSKNIGIIIDHFKRFMKPSNFFLVPNERGALGELKEFIDEMK